MVVVGRFSTYSSFNATELPAGFPELSFRGGYPRSSPVQFPGTCSGMPFCLVPRTARGQQPQPEAGFEPGSRAFDVPYSLPS